MGDPHPSATHSVAALALGYHLDAAIAAIA